jgi:hypothetical protein
MALPKGIVLLSRFSQSFPEAIQIFGDDPPVAEGLAKFLISQGFLLGSLMIRGANKEVTGSLSYQTAKIETGRMGPTLSAFTTWLATEFGSLKQRAP